MQLGMKSKCFFVDMNLLLASYNVDLNLLRDSYNEQSDKDKLPLQLYKLSKNIDSMKTTTAIERIQ